MLLVREVSGPATAAIDEHVTYSVTSFNREPKRGEDGAVNWLVKSTDGAALLSETKLGSELTLRIPETWAGKTAIVMPYVNSPSATVSVRTIVADRPGAGTGGSARDVKVMREKGGRWYASVDDEPRFYLGTRVRYKERRGLMNWANPPGDRYRSEDYEGVHGQWAWYLRPTITCESNGFFTCLNTYDRARFTFGHLQLAAHTPDENFVAFFREILQQLPTAIEYFSDLTVRSGRIHRITDTGPVALESSNATTALMNYLNPTPDEVDEIEAERAARFVDWCLRDPGMRAKQVEFGVRQTQGKLRSYAKRLPLHGLVDKLCLVVLDILHQGRGGRTAYSKIEAALGADNSFDALLSIGASEYGERIGTLRAGIRDLEALGKVGRLVYDKASGDFVIPPGA